MIEKKHSVPDELLARGSRNKRMGMYESDAHFFF